MSGQHVEHGIIGHSKGRDGAVVSSVSAQPIDDLALRAIQHEALWREPPQVRPAQAARTFRQELHVRCRSPPELGGYRQDGPGIRPRDERRRDRAKEHARNEVVNDSTRADPAQTQHEDARKEGQEHLVAHPPHEILLHHHQEHEPRPGDGLAVHPTGLARDALVRSDRDEHGC